MLVNQATNLLVSELERAERKFPTFPVDSIHAASVVVEEAGELEKAALEFTYEDAPKELMYKEAVHTGAMALRFILMYDYLKALPSKQVARHE